MRTILASHRLWLTAQGASSDYAQATRALSHGGCRGCSQCAHFCTSTTGVRTCCQRREKYQSREAYRIASAPFPRQERFDRPCRSALFDCRCHQLPAYIETPRTVSCQSLLLSMRESKGVLAIHKPCVACCQASLPLKNSDRALSLPI